MKLYTTNAGALSTIQDAGCWQGLRSGVPLSGAMDSWALAAANAVLDNPLDSAAIEITGGGAVFEVLEPVLLAVTGADLVASLNAVVLPLWTALFVRAGDQLMFHSRREEWGARAYLAFRGGVDVPLVLGSRSTNLTSAFGGLHGRVLRAGDELQSVDANTDMLMIAGRRWPAVWRPAYCAEPALRFIAGPHTEYFDENALAELMAQPLRIGTNSNRMGYRLEGRRISYTRSTSLSSLGVIPGVIQIPPDGMPVLLMADAQTTGGYPIIGVVCAVDLPLAAQLLPGDRLCLRAVSLEEALAARLAQASYWSTGIGLEEDVWALLNAAL